MPSTYDHWTESERASFAKGLLRPLEEQRLCQWDRDEAWEDVMGRVSRLYAAEQTEMDIGQLYVASGPERAAYRDAYKRMHAYLKSLTEGQRMAQMGRMADTGAFPDCSTRREERVAEAMDTTPGLNFMVYSREQWLALADYLDHHAAQWAALRIRGSLVYRREPFVGIVCPRELRRVIDGALDQIAAARAGEDIYAAAIAEAESILREHHAT
jgi:hypothetical protein